MCADEGWQPDEPARADRALRFIARLQAAGGVGGRALTYATIAAYKSALHTHFEMTAPAAGVPNPWDALKVIRALEGVRKRNAQREQHARESDEPSEPLTFERLERLRLVHDDDERERMLFAAIAIAVGASLRPNELLGLVNDPNDPRRERALHARQVRFFADDHGTVPMATSSAGLPRAATIWLPISKTDQQRRGTTRDVGAQLSVHTLWHWMRFLEARGARGNYRLFALGGEPLSNNVLIGHLRRRLAQAGIAGHFTLRCFRKGQASSLDAQGIAPAFIERAGGWAPGSRAVHAYTSHPAVQRARQLAVARDVALMSSAGPRSGQ